jgi:hypothetical protein
VPNLAKSLAGVHVQRDLGLWIFGLHLGGHDMQKSARVKSPRLAVLGQPKLVFGRNASDVIQGGQIFIIDTFGSVQYTGARHLQSTANSPATNPFLDDNLFLHMTSLNINPARGRSRHPSMDRTLLHSGQGHVWTGHFRPPSPYGRTSHSLVFRGSLKISDENGSGGFLGG